MPCEFRNLDTETWEHMVREVETASRDGNLYYGRRFNENGEVAWPGLLLETAQDHEKHWLAYQLEVLAPMNGVERSVNPFGGSTEKHVPHSAAETLAEGQFNRYNILGLCGCTMIDSKLTVYRAKSVSRPRPDAEALVGERLVAAEISPFQSSLEHVLLKPNSSLSVHL